ncbi:MAG: primosomal protein N' [Cyanothece sp. SIO1E1]|nr:primosomal protein N' [Cyanothece sp. SIO1E1]
MDSALPISASNLTSPHVKASPTVYIAEVNQWVEVLVDCPSIQGLYIYRLPPTVTVSPGDILSVPFGAQQIGAIALHLINQLPPHLDPAQIREVEAVISAGFFTPHYWALLDRIAQFYQSPLIQVIRTALPPGLLGRSQRRIRLKPEHIPTDADVFLSAAAQRLLALLQSAKTGDYSWQFLQQRLKGLGSAFKQLQQRGWAESYLVSPKAIRPKLKQAVTLIQDPAALPHNLTVRQQEILAVLKRQGGDLWLSDALQICRTTVPTLKSLAKKGYLTLQEREVLRSDLGPAVMADRPKSLTPAQAAALTTIRQQSEFAQVLLHGVTGSGKTEVYLQAIAPRLQAGQSILVLVPEIGLTPQLTDRFRARFGSQVCVYHSALSEGERYDTWRQMLSGQPQVVIGTRSAIFAPLPDLGLIILDEEHDSSFKQDQPAPCYHARTIAQWRAELENCPLILGSATPSLESWVGVGIQSPQKLEGTNIQSLYLSLPQRIHARPMPPIQVIDMRQELHAGNKSIFSRSLQTALERLQARREQGILFIHRRGHSTFVSCRSCGYVMGCPHCDVSLSYHHPHAGAEPTLRCHYCNYRRSHPPICPECSSPYLKNFGSGTQRVTEALAKQFPDLRYIRFDSDTTRAKGAHRALLTRFAQGDADVLVGTQMLTKGIDLPQVTLVGVVAADGLLYLGDYRASERAFQTLTQVAGRCGRGDDPGQVIIQTYTPEHPVIEAVQTHAYESFMTTELQQRQALNYPPYGQLILLRLSSPDPVAVQKTAAQIATLLQASSLDSDSLSYELLGPSPAPILRVARRYRWHILLKFPPPVAELPDLTGLRSHCPGNVSLTIDVDPINLA